MTPPFPVVYLDNHLLAPSTTPLSDAAFDVVYLDNHLLVVIKPAGLLAQADRTGDPDLLTLGKAYLKARFDKPGAVFLGLVHRLDRPVSGLTVLARTSKAAARLAETFRERTAEKRYLAVVEGRLDGAGERVDFLVKEDEHVRIAQEGEPGAKRAALRWKAVATDGKRTLVEVELLTGRPHQVRVQLAAMAAPILGDRRHGARTAFGDRGLALHAYRLAFEHPVRREPVAFSAPPPLSWAGLFEHEIATLVASVGPNPTSPMGVEA